jgi:hypothetical protein
MAIRSVQWNWFTGWNSIITREINFPPNIVGAQAALHGATGAGTQFTGIQHIRRRLPDGSDQNIDFGSWLQWPPAIWNTDVTAVTFGLATGVDQQGWVLARMDFFD